MADIGWITGHSYIFYGPWRSPQPACSTKAYRNSPTPAVRGASPNAWTSIFSTLSPTAIRMLRKAGFHEPKIYNYKFKAHDHGR